jgi:hypothetical protein
MTFRFSVLFFGLSALILSGCLFLRPPNTARFEPIPLEPAPTVSPQPDSQASPAKTLHIYLIALEDAGKSGPKVGCGDSLVAVDVRAEDNISALQTVLVQHSQYYGQSGLYNALYQSSLTISRFEAAAGKFEVDLTGDLTLGGVCDNPRVEQQLKAVIRQSTDDSIPATIRINGVLLEDLLSQK